jgi:uncharacterized protein YndB with AHSA1/START domain
VADYEFLTTWCLTAPIDRVFDVLHDEASYPQWWKGVKSVEILEPSGDGGVGQLARYSWRSVLPYTLTFDARVSRVEKPYLMEGQARGELEGVGLWRLYEGPDGTAVVYSWNVRTTKAWMNALGPLPRPVFRWNHDLVMRQGGVGLARRLGATLLASG